MADVRHHYIQVSLGTDGQIICDPTKTHVAAGDTVQWRSVAGAIVVHFGPDTPFDRVEDWTADAGFLTSHEATVKAGFASPLTPIISLKGNPGKKTIGEIIP